MTFSGRVGRDRPFKGDRDGKMSGRMESESETCREFAEDRTSREQSYRDLLRLFERIISRREPPLSTYFPLRVFALGKDHRRTSIVIPPVIFDEQRISYAFMGNFKMRTIGAICKDM